jgi:hypothetical protein
MVEQTVQEAENEVKVTTEAKVTAEGEGVRVTSRVFSASPTGKTSTSEPFTREVFKGALDKAGRRIRGKYADVPTSSEEFAKRKQEEIELEERRR